MDTNQHIEANSISPQIASDMVASWKATQIGYLLCVTMVPFFVGFVAPKLPGIEELLIPPLTEKLLFNTIPNCTMTIFAVAVAAYVLANIYLAARKILKITSSAPYQVSDGTYIRHRVWSKRNKYGYARHRLIVKFKDSHGRTHKALSPMANRGYFQEMNKGDSVTVVSVKGFLGARRYHVFIPQYFNEQNATN